MRAWTNLAPAAVFFAAYYFWKGWADIAPPSLAAFVGEHLDGGAFQFATAALILTMGLQLIFLRAFFSPVRTGEWGTFALVAVFGGVTLLLRDTLYLQVKTTVVNWLFAAGFLAADFLFNKNLLRLLLGGAVSASDALWRRLSSAMAGVFALVGAVNLIVIFNFSEEAWVWAKTFAYPAVNLFALLLIVACLWRGGSLKETSDQ